MGKQVGERGSKPTENERQGQGCRGHVRHAAGGQGKPQGVEDHGGGQQEEEQEKAEDGAEQRGGMGREKGGAVVALGAAARRWGEVEGDDGGWFHWVEA